MIAALPEHFRQYFGSVYLVLCAFCISFPVFLYSCYSLTIVYIFMSNAKEFINTALYGFHVSIKCQNVLEIFAVFRQGSAMNSWRWP